MQPETLAMILAGNAKKGDVLGTARIAGIMAAKKTHELIPLCHPLLLTKVAVDIEPDQALPGLRVTALARVTGKTGVEMEALTAASVACLTIYDMAKAVDRGMVISGIRLVEKTGGKSGDYQAEAPMALLPVAEALHACLTAPSRWPAKACRCARRRAACWPSRSWRCARSRPSMLRPWMAMRCAPPMSRSVPARLAVIGMAAAGRGFEGTVGEGEAVRIFTGAPVPDGADTIVIQENVRDLGGGAIEVFETDRARAQYPPRRPRLLARAMPCWKKAACSTRRRLSLAASANHPALDVVQPAAGRDHRHRRRTAAAGQQARPRPDHRIQRLWRRGARGAAGARVLDLGIVPDRRTRSRRWCNKASRPAPM